MKLTDLDNVASPKRMAGTRREQWYPYYAGYSSEFVRDVLKVISKPEQTVLDPWNGSGTTTCVGSRLNREVSGYDISPVMATVAQARQLPNVVRSSALALGREITRSSEAVVINNEPLTAWLVPRSAAILRGYERRIAQLFEEPNRQTYQNIAIAPSVLSSFFLMALFGAVRELLEPFRASNPTWLKYPAAPSRRLRPSDRRIAEVFEAAVELYSSRLQEHSPDTSARAHIRIVESTTLDDKAETFDACLTSPPYLTRLDYTRATLAELSVLGIAPSAVKQLRDRSIGTPVTSGYQLDHMLPSSTAQALVAAIGAHDSKGSHGYYDKWAAKYFASLSQSLSNVSKAVKPSGVVGIVVQDSYYKGIRVDLQRVVEEFMNHNARRLAARVDFNPTHVRAWMHPQAKRHSGRLTAVESLLVFQGES